MEQNSLSLRISKNDQLFNRNSVKKFSMTIMSYSATVWGPTELDFLFTAESTIGTPSVFHDLQIFVDSTRRPLPTLLAFKLVVL